MLAHSLLRQGAAGQLLEDLAPQAISHLEELNGTDLANLAWTYSLAAVSQNLRAWCSDGSLNLDIIVLHLRLVQALVTIRDGMYYLLAVFRANAM